MILSANRFPLRRITRERAEGIRLSQSLDREARNVGGRGQPFNRGKAIAARCDQFFQFLFAKSVNEAKAEPHRRAPVQPSPARGGGSSRLQRAIPIAEIDVDGTDLHVVLARIAHQLRRLIKTHWLAVENGGAEHVRIAAFDERRGIDKKRKARRVTFRKPYSPKPSICPK